MSDVRPIVSLVKQLLAPIKRAVTGVVSRGVVNLVNESYKLQNLQVELVDGEIRDDVEHFQEYGFTSRAKAGAEAIAVAVGGNRSHLVVLCVADRSLRPKLAEGDVCLFTPAGERVYLDAAGDLVNLGARTATDFVALASNTENRLAALETFVATHTHTSTAPGNPTSPPVPPPTPAFNTPPAPVAATKVKAI